VGFLGTEGKVEGPSQNSQREMRGESRKASQAFVCGKSQRLQVTKDNKPDKHVAGAYNTDFSCKVGVEKETEEWMEKKKKKAVD